MNNNFNNIFNLLFFFFFAMLIYEFCEIVVFLVLLKINCLE